MRLITQTDGGTALLLEEPARMELAHDIALSASWLDDHKHLFGGLHLNTTAASLCEKLHKIAHTLAANRAGEIYDQEETQPGGEDDMEQARRLAGTACCSEEDGGPGWAGVETPAVAA